ncbi:MAG: tetratricopeptide repeat protein [Betaproteobacteria bacterium]|nr:tetratricopeptide repeat protein [Betaproteobacteria bacterium]
MLSECRRNRYAAAVFFAAAAALCTPVWAQAAGDSDDEDEPALALEQQIRPPAERLPLLDMSEAVLYEYLLAEIALQRGSGGLAAQSLVDLAKSTRDPRIARRATEVGAFARLPNLAIEAARLWHETDPGSAQALQTLTVLLVNARRIDEAEPFLAKLMAVDASAAANGFLQMGRFLSPNADKAANLRLVQRLAGAHAQLPEAHFALAQAAYAANDEALALAEVRRASELRPEWENAALFEAQILQRSLPDAAAERLAAFLDKRPESREVRLNYARVLVGTKRYAEARREFGKLLAAYPNDQGVIYAVGLLAVQLKDFDSAEANLKRLLELNYRDPNAVRYTLGQIAEERKDYGGAQAWYAQVTRGEHFLASRLRYAQTLAKQGRLDDARSYLRGVGEGASAQQTQLTIAEAQLLREANQHGEAFSLLGKALEGQPEQPDLLYDFALTAEKLERFDVLEANLKKLIQVKPDHAHAYNALGYSFAERNTRLDEARKLIERALELAPEDSFIIDSMGWVYYRMGDLPKAAEYLNRAWQGRPDAEIGAHLGEVLWVSGERSKAEVVWKEAGESNPDNEVLRKTVQRFLPR